MKKKIFVIIPAAIVCLILGSFQSYAFDDESSGAKEELKLYLGEPQMVPANGPTRIAIGNPNILDVTKVSKNEILINPKAAGSTSFIFWDVFGEHPFIARVMTENMQDVKSRIDKLLESLDLPDVYTQPRDEEGKVLLLGKVKTAQDRERISTGLGSLKDKTIDLIQVKEEESSVEIDVQILELNKDATNTLGFTWPGALNIAEIGSPGLSSAGTKWSTLFKVSDLWRASRSDSTFTADPFNWKLDLLIQEGKARVLSRPRLTCQSGKEAELLVGGEKPVMTTSVVASSGAQATEVEYKEFGIKLKIKPTVTEDLRIKLAVNVEVSEFSDTAITLGSSTNTTAKAYPLTKRTASTELYLDDGQTLSIGGLIKHKTEEDLRKFPWLADVPVLGLFFRQRTTKVGGGEGTRGDTELFITLTPKLIMTESRSLRESKDKTKSAAPRINSVFVSSGQDMSNSPIVTYSRVVQQRIMNELQYPSSAKAAGFQGTVSIRLHLSSRGDLLEALLGSSSGYKILDDNALSVAKRISLYPPFPSSIDKNELWIDVPIVYQLD